MDYELVILGSGEAGYLAWTLANEGKRVALIERKYIGGQCPINEEFGNARCGVAGGNLDGLFTEPELARVGLNETPGEVEKQWEPFKLQCERECRIRRCEMLSSRTPHYSRG